MQQLSTKTVRPGNNKYKCTMDQELLRIQRTSDVTRARWASGQPANAAACAAEIGVRAAILKVLRRIRNATPSIDAYLLEEQSCQISSRSDLK